MAPTLPVDSGPSRHARAPASNASSPEGLRTARVHASLLLGAGGVLAGLVATAIASGQLPRSPALALLLASALPGAVAAAPSVGGQLPAHLQARLMRGGIPVQLALLLGAVAFDGQGAASPLVLLLVLPLLPAAWSMAPLAVCALGAGGMSGLAVLAHRGDALTATAFTTAAVMGLVTIASALTAHAERERTSAQASLNAELSVLAHRDGLTGCLNHRAFQERLTEEAGRALRYRRHLALLLLDLDDFKGLNDTHGHPAGDRIIRAVGSLLRDLGRSADVSGRLGGDEFALLLPETSADDAVIVATRLRARIAEISDPEPVTGSIGIAALPETAHGARDLVHQADEALYAAKRGGRGLVRRYGAESAESAEAPEPSTAAEPSGPDPAFARRIADIITNDKLVAEVQPVVRLTDGACVAYEAVGRVRGSPLPLPQWLEVAEHSDLRAELERTWWTAVRRLGPPPAGTRLFVELSGHASARELHDLLLRDRSCAPTEPPAASAGAYRTTTRSLASWAVATTTLSVAEAHDTTAVGAETIEHLAGLEPRWLKLPANLVGGCDRKPGRMALIAALRAFADRAGGSLVAEGVERPGEVQALRLAGVRYAHGPLFADPGPPWPTVDPAAVDPPAARCR